MIDELIKTLEEARTANRKLLDQLHLVAEKHYQNEEMEVGNYWESKYNEVLNVWITIDNLIAKHNEET